jgi:hypothetical protein
MRSIIKYIRQRMAKSLLTVRLGTAVAFLLFAYLGGNSASDLMAVSRAAMRENPLHVAVPDGAPRYILLALSAVIAVASLFTAAGALQRSNALRAYMVVTVAFVLYGGYVMAVALLELNSPLTAITGGAYLALAAAAFSFGQRAIRALSAPSAARA